MAIVRGLLLTALLASSNLAAAADPTPKEKLLVPPTNATHYTLSSTSTKSGDYWAWTLPDGRRAYRTSVNLRGWITEVDKVVTLAPDGTVTDETIRGFTDVGSAEERYTLGADGIGRWTTSIDSGAAPAAGKIYSSYGGSFLASELMLNALVAAGPKGIDLLPGGHGSLSLDRKVVVDGPKGKLPLQLAFYEGFGFSPGPIWLDANKKLFGSAGTLSILPAGYESVGPALKKIQEDVLAERVSALATQFLAPANRTPTLIDGVRIFDSVGGKYVADQAVLVQGGRIARIGKAGSLKAPAGTVRIDGKGRTLLPGLWDSHRHTGGPGFDLVNNLAIGMTNYRSPGSQIDETLELAELRKAGKVLAPDGKVSVIVDRKDPLAAQGSIAVSSEAEAIEAVRKIKAAGLWGVKFYTSMTPAWIKPAAAEAHRLGLHVNGHVPAGMRPLDAVRAGYDEVTHINFIMMQAMPQEVVDKANTAARLEGPAKYGKDVDLDSPAMKAFYAELAQRGTYVDPTLSVWEPMMVSDGSEIPPEYAGWARVAPPEVARGWRVSGYPLFDGLTRDDFRKSFDKMVGVVGRLHKAGVRVVAGTDGYGMELIRELELYRMAGMTNAEALQTATIIPARMVGMDKTHGSVEVGKVANLLLVEGDVSQSLDALRKVRTVFLDGYRLDGDALRKAAGYSGMPD